MKTLIFFVCFIVFKQVSSTYYRPSKVTHVEALGDVSTVEFVKRLEENVTSYIHTCIKDEQSCTNSSLSLGTEVYKWPITTKADITNIMKDLKKTINNQVQLMTVGMRCHDSNRSMSMFSQLEESITSEIDRRVGEQIELKVEDLSRRHELEIKNLSMKYEQDIHNLSMKYEQDINTLNNRIANNTIDLSNAVKELTKIKSQIQFDRPSDCGDLPAGSKSGVYDILPGKGQGFKVYCEMEEDDGGWTVFQRRMDGSTDFFLGWCDYEDGFGDLQKEFWLGNFKLHMLTSDGKYELRINLEDFENNKRYAKYTSFSVGGGCSNYKLTVEGYSGNAVDSLTNHNGRQFSTKDRDNDASRNNCAQQFKGAWWYESCHNSNLNGKYLNGTFSSFADGVTWKGWKGQDYSLKYTSMMLRKVK